MAAQSVSKGYADARKGKPPVGGVRDASRAGKTPGFTQPAPRRKTPEVSHTEGRRNKATRVAGKAAITAVAPEARLGLAGASKARKAAPARILPSGDKQNRTHKVTIKPPASDKRTKSAFRSAGNHAPVLMAEFILAMMVIIMKTITDTAKTSYQEAMALAMLQASALTGVFFILFLISSGKRSSKAAAWFGALVDLGVLFTAVNAGAITDFTSLVQGKGLPSSTVLLSENKPKEYYDTAENFTTSSDISNFAGGTATATPA